MNIPTFDSRLFRGTAKYYLRYRSTYPDGLIQRVARICQLSGASRVLDLGCGPGILARAFAPYCGEVVAVDPEPDMIAAAQDHLAGLAGKARFLRAGAHELARDLGSFSVVVIGRAFHWMDRRATLDVLDQLIDRTGAVVLFRDPALKLPENAWRKEFDRIFSEFAASDAARQGAQPLDTAIDEAHLLRSSFSRLERISTVETHVRSIEYLIGRGFSMAGTSPDDLLDKRPAFEDAMRSALTPFAADGKLLEITEPQALIARRQD